MVDFKIPKFKFESLVPIAVGIIILYIILHCLSSHARRKKQADKFAGVINTLLLSRGRHLRNHQQAKQHVDNITHHVVHEATHKVVEKATPHVVNTATPQVVKEANHTPVTPQKVYVPVKEVQATPQPTPQHVIVHQPTSAPQQVVVQQHPQATVQPRPTPQQVVVQHPQATVQPRPTPQQVVVQHPQATVQPAVQTPSTMVVAQPQTTLHPNQQQVVIVEESPGNVARVG
jgi:FtsZ-interacting cell division protein ZipA